MQIEMPAQRQRAKINYYMLIEFLEDSWVCEQWEWKAFKSD